MTFDLDHYQLEGEELPILTYPHPVLKKKAKEVTLFDDELALFCKNMLYTMYLAPGVGLAAPQVGKSLRIFCLDIHYEKKKTLNAQGEEVDTYSDFSPIVLINPKFIKREGELIFQEGCLSLPGIYEDMNRYAHIVVEYQNVKGELLQIEATDLLAVCIQHENDHLDGIVMLDYMKPMKKNLLKKKLIKQKKKLAHE
jgi:peptide deformylase